MVRTDRENAIQLRKTGKSYSEIREKLRIPKSTLSDWLGPADWSLKIQKKLRECSKVSSKVRLQFLNKIRGERLNKVYKEAKNEAQKELSELKYHPLFIAGVVAYWGEGDKVSDYNVRITNTDPAMIRLFVDFLKNVCQVPPERIKAWLLIYPDLEERKCLQFWTEKAGLKEQNFNKTITINGRHKTNRLKYGICNVGVSSKYLKQKMLLWLELLPYELLNKKYYAGLV